MNTLHPLDQIASDIEAMLCDASSDIELGSVYHDRKQIILSIYGYQIIVTVHRHEERPLINCRHLIDGSVTLMKPDALPLDYLATADFSDTSELVLCAIVEGFALEAEAIR